MAEIQTLAKFTNTATLTYVLRVASTFCKRLYLGHLKAATHKSWGVASMVPYLSTAVRSVSMASLCTGREGDIVILALRLVTGLVPRRWQIEYSALAFISLLVSFPDGVTDIRIYIHTYIYTNASRPHCSISCLVLRRSATSKQSSQAVYVDLCTLPNQKIWQCCSGDK